MASSPSFADEIRALYRDEAPRMRSYARRRLPDPEDAEDAVQETFADLTILGSLRDIRNPKGWLMTTLNRIIVEALRRKYIHQNHLEKGAFSARTTSSDIAEEYERSERDTLVSASVDALDPVEGRILRLYSHSYKPSEIALIVSASGSPTTSRQVTVALYQAWPKLKSQFRKRGVVPVTLPVPWLVPQLRIRLRALLCRMTDLVRALEYAATASAFGLIALLPLNPTPNWRMTTPHGPNIPATNSQIHQSSDSTLNLNGAASRSARGGARTGSDRSVVAEVDLGGEQHRVDQWDENHEGSPPSLAEQLIEMIEDPGKIPLPKCWGIEVCPSD